MDDTVPDIMLKKNKQLTEIDKGIDKLNVWFIINTIFTVVMGLAMVALAVLEFLK